MLWSVPSTTDPVVRVLESACQKQTKKPHPRSVTWADFASRRMPPKTDQCRDPGWVLVDASEDVASAALTLGAQTTNSMIYPANSMMSWHTNSDAPGKRRYYTWSAEGGSVFRYLDPETDQVVDEVEPPGWVVRAFTIPRPEEGYFWHAVYSPVLRYSFGFLMP